MATSVSTQDWRYSKDLPVDRKDLSKAWKLFESYSDIPRGEVDDHVAEIRDKAFSIFHYPCLGRWRFLQLYITDSPVYDTVLARLKSGDTLLDVGCCFGQILRQLAFDGAPADHLAGTDLRPEFIDLGYELFRDREKFAARFVAGDMLEPADPALRTLDGQFDIIHSASFFHLFGWDEQIAIGERVVRFLKPAKADKALILGRQVGTDDPMSLEEYRSRREAGTLERDRYVHNVESFQKLWDEVGKRTGTRWKVTGDLSAALFGEAPTPKVILRYIVTGAPVMK